MGTERELLELEAARVRLERERLALAREQRTAERPAQVVNLARGMARSGVEVAAVAKGPALVAGNFLFRLTCWNLLWLIAVAIFALILKLSSTSYQGLEYLAAFGHVIGMTMFVAIPLTIVFTFWFSDLNRAISTVTATSVIFFLGGTALNLWPSPLWGGAPPSQSEITRAIGRSTQVFSADCRVPSSKQLGTVAYTAQISSIERDYPALNPDSPEYQAKWEQLVVQQKEQLEKQGRSACVAARLAADAVMAGRQ